MREALQDLYEFIRPLFNTIQTPNAKGARVTFLQREPDQAGAVGNTGAEVQNAAFQARNVIRGLAYDKANTLLWDAALTDDLMEGLRLLTQIEYDIPASVSEEQMRTLSATTTNVARQAARVLQELQLWQQDYEVFLLANFELMGPEALQVQADITALRDEILGEVLVLPRQENTSIPAGLARDNYYLQLLGSTALAQDRDYNVDRTMSQYDEEVAVRVEARLSELEQAFPPPTI